MKKFCFLALFISISIIKLTGQQREACISFNEEKYDFGTVKDEDKPLIHVFDFINTGGTPLIINNVEASCGCTTPDWSKQPIPPGGKGFVKATYNPAGRAGGTFSKTITVNSNSIKQPKCILTISGNVFGKPPIIEAQFTFAMDSLRFKSNYIGFQTLNPGMIKSDSLQFINIGHSAITIGFINLPAFLKAKVIPAIIKPGEKGYIKVTYFSSLRQDWDFLVDYLNLTINGKHNPEKFKITIAATIEEDFSNLTKEQLDNAPKIKFDKGVYDFGTAKAGDTIHFSFICKNEGKSDLILRKIKTSCSTCVKIDNTDNIIKSGGNSIIKGIYITHKQNSQETITIVTNDPEPKKRLMRLYIRGTVN